MSFTTHRPEIELVVALVRQTSKPGCVLSDTVAESLVYLCEHASLFDHLVSDSPFKTHFFSQLELCSDSQDHSLAFTLFEDIAVFFREKTLRSRESPSALEEKVLHIFEHCGEWDEKDTTLVSIWYWSKLPKRAHKASSTTRSSQPLSSTCQTS